MPGISDFSVPSYLQPMSDAQSAQVAEGQARIGIADKAEGQQAAVQQQLMRERDFEMKQRAADLLERKLTMARIQARTQELSAMPGMDPQTAMDRAMLENAPSIWKDHPEAMAAGEGALWNRIKKTQAVNQSKVEAQALLNEINPKTGEKYTPEEASITAYWKNIFALDEGAASPGTAIGTAVRGEQMAGYRSQNLARMKERDARIAELKAAGLELGQDTLAERSLHNQAMEEAAAKKDKPDVKLELQSKGGKDFIVNPKTGHFQEIEKGVSKSTFISQHVSKWMTDLGVNEDEAAKRLSKFYDDYIGKKTPTKASEPNVKKSGEPLKLGSLVEIGGKKYRYQGGPTDDMSSFKPE